MKRNPHPRRNVPAARLLIVDDHELIRDGLRRVFGDEPGLDVVGEATSGREAVDLCRRLRPDVVLLDARMPDLDGLAATRAIKQEHSAAHVLLITLNDNPEYVLEALKAGAAGYVLKGATKREILHAVTQVLRGEAVLSPELATDSLRRRAGETRGEV
jgi:DNA-binding NarL/FixJ family response regulator